MGATCMSVLSGGKICDLNRHLDPWVWVFA